MHCLAKPSFQRKLYISACTRSCYSSSSSSSSSTPIQQQPSSSWSPFLTFLSSSSSSSSLQQRSRFFHSSSHIFFPLHNNSAYSISTKDFKARSKFLAQRRNIAVSVVANMVKGIKVHQVGGPEVLKWEDIEVKEPGEGEVKVKHTAVGVNYIDVNYRNGAYKTSTPFIPGFEAAGVVTAVGPGLTGLNVGDRIAYAGSLGSYTEEKIISADKLVPLPSSVDDVMAASIMLKGMTAQMLLRRVFKVKKGHKIFVHAAAGGVGSLLVQWAKGLGATVIAAVSNEEKAAQAKEDGADHVIIYSQQNFVDRVKEITEGAGVNVVYDAVGKDTLMGSLECLGLRGYLVNYGQASGPPDPLPISALQPKSLFLTRPTLFHYTSIRDELLEAAGELFAAVATGVIKIRTNHIYRLSEAAKAHADLEGRKTMGSCVLIPDSIPFPIEN